MAPLSQRLPGRLLLAAACAAFLLARPALAQDDGSSSPEGEPVPSYNTGAGLEILLTNNGFGLGGYYQHRLSSTTSFLMEASIGPGKDERELKFFSRFGGGFIPNKRNYLLMLPLQVGLQQRLFRRAIEDNFRPYLQLAGGPTLGWEYPYFDDSNGNDRYDDGPEGTGERRYDVISGFPRGSAVFGVGGTLALGAHFGTSQRLTQGVRFGYSFTYFFDGVTLLEPHIKPSQSLFHTPVISLTFGRIF